MKSVNCRTSKNPLLFDFDLHIDDSKGVGLEGIDLGFNTIIVDSDDAFWTEKIWKELIALEIESAVSKEV